MGAIEMIVYFTVTWIMVAVFATVGFIFGRYSRTFDPGPRKIVSRKTLPALKPEEPVVPGVDLTRERMSIVARAKQEYGLNDQDAQKFADNIIKLGGATLGRLHSKG